MPQLLRRSLVRVLVALLVTSVVVVPTIMRARQHVELRDSTSLGTRLNWKSDAPPQKTFFVPSPHTQTAVDAIAVATLQRPPRLVTSVRPADAPPRRTAFDNAPDLFRGPPSRSL